MLLKKNISIYYFLNLIKWDIIAIAIYATLVGALDHFAFFEQISIPLSISALVGTLLSLLLAFRTSQSYERWWEARVIWGAIVNDSRSLIRQLIHLLPNDDKKAWYVKEFAVRQAMWCYTLADSLRKVPFSGRAAEYFEKRSYKSDNRPNFLLTKHVEQLIDAGRHYQLNPNIQVQLDNSVVKLTDHMGKCERIKNTIFPRSYSVLIHFLIYVLMTILPFGLDDNHPIVEAVLATFIPVLFIAIERTAILMQDPFENRPTDTPMTTLSETIEKNLMELANLEVGPQPDAQGEYYVM
ncbi:bestrophin family protein [Mucilaginibacter auburnensis]|uniref:Putative membrane protein n=1 Tax=Mucilaginibacter auburnensis TaxID=1457233 RepID=A0A2H9VRI5_9SPHI|nr:bestrophin family ion channel [Mucilaginibacter auburnensis]PJJ83430.1 putative membrane protein [Mucilaginibacter auburnensis]